MSRAWNWRWRWPDLFAVAAGRLTAGPPQGETTPGPDADRSPSRSWGSDPRSGEARGQWGQPLGRPKAGPAPLGGSDPRSGEARGQRGQPLGRPKAGPAPLGGSDPRQRRSVGAKYRGRFAPSPTGPLHAGSLVAALASWLDARAHGGAWLVRMEDVDAPRCVPGADQLILQQLAACGLVSDAPVVWQSQRSGWYQTALERLVAQGQAYPCACSRKDIAAALQATGADRQRHHAAVYPGTCRPERGGPKGPGARAWRFGVAAGAVDWSDRRLGAQSQDVNTEVGDFVLLRADGLWAYQLAVVVDDAEQGITHVVRGQDLADNTPRQRLLQQALGLPPPTYLHTPLVLGSQGEKLSKQNGARPLDLGDPLATLGAAAAVLGLPTAHGPVAQALLVWTRAWPWRLGAPA